jgi:hypothetical protein
MTFIASSLVGGGSAVNWGTILFPPIAAVRLLRRGGKRTRVESDFELTKPGRLNSLLARTFSLEAPLVERVNLPFGVSLLALATPDERGT